MVVLNVVYKTKPGKRDDFYNAILDKAAFFRTEKGNIQYKYYFATDNDTDIVLIEKWETEEDLAAHSSTEVFDSLQGLKAEYIEEVVLDKFIV